MKPLSEPTVLTGVFLLCALYSENNRPCSIFIRRGEMEKVIGVKDLRNAGLLGTEYTELDLYDAFMMYLIVNNTSNNDRIILRNGNYTLDTKSCFCKDGWLV